jgi:hypothetical protein
VQKTSYLVHDRWLLLSNRGQVAHGSGLGDLAQLLRLRRPPRVVRRTQLPRFSAIKDKAPYPFGISGREQGAHRDALRPSHQRRAFGADRIHHHAHVVHPRLKRRSARHPVRHASAALVEMNQTRERRELFQDTRVLATSQPSSTFETK